MIHESFNMAIRNILQNKMRSFLTVLGIIIGVATIISLITIVNGVQTEIMNNFNALGANTLTVTASGNGLKMGITDAELQKIEAIDGVKAVSPTVSASVSVVANGETVDKVTVEGKSAAYFEKEDDLVELGRGLLTPDITNNSAVAVVNSSFVENNMQGTTVLGSTITIGGVRYEVIGIAKKSSGVAAAMSGADACVYIPYNNALRLMNSDSIVSFEIYVKDDADIDLVKDEVEELLDSFFNYKDNSYMVINLQSMLDMMESVKSMMQGLLAGVASISLLVGGIGIMNMMLVSVTERTVEIGLRKALGAKPSDIQMQFLLEAVILSLVGGFLGLLMGLGISVAASNIIDMPFVFSGFATTLGIGFSAAVGIIFGWAPARKASQLSPIDALRSN